MKNKIGIELPKQTIDALLNGANMFIIPINNDNQIWLHDSKCKYFEEILPLQAGDEFYVQEDIKICNECCERMSHEYRDCYCSQGKIIDAKTTYKQSIVKSNIVNVKIKRIQDININKDFTIKVKKYFEKFTYHCTTEPINFKRHRAFKEYLKEIEIDYNKNPYIILYTIKIKEG